MALTVLAALFIACRDGQRDDEALIRAARDENNRAIAAHDTAAIAARWLPEFWLVSSANAQSAGRDAARARFGQIFATRKDVVFLRTPQQIHVNASWGQAAESGSWTGRWMQSDSLTLVGGPYFAKWRKVDGKWMLLAEVYVQTICTGSSYCASPP